MNKRNPLAAYGDVNENVYGPDFEKKWYESVVMILQLCQTAWKNGQGIRENSVENCPP